MSTPISEEQIRKKLMMVEDPEIHVDIVNLGLIYGIEIADTAVTVKMTMTSPGCPYAPMLLQMTKSAVYTVEGVKDATIDLVWSPPWDPRTMASDDAKATLGIWD